MHLWQHSKKGISAKQGFKKDHGGVSALKRGGKAKRSAQIINYLLIQGSG